MRKARRGRSVSVDRCMSPLPSSSSDEGIYSSNIYVESKENMKEWEEARCTVCMEHPHNAVLLICSSHEKGCRPYMCNTSHRQSNCLDQFRKSFKKSTQTEAGQENAVVSEGSSGVQAENDGDTAVSVMSSDNQALPNLVCPLCRGHVNDWIVVESARKFMNAKARSCACETCNFNGNYSDLRNHARLEHPLVRPSEADPERQRNWRSLEHQRDIGDLVSIFQSPYEWESGEYRIVPDNENGGLPTVMFMVSVVRPRRRSPRMSTRGRFNSNIRRLREMFEEQDVSSSIQHNNESSDGDSVNIWRRRLRRRMSPNNQPPT